MTPRYDILSAYPVLGHGRGKLSPHKIKMAMAIRGKNTHYLWKDFSAHHWIETAKRSGLTDMESILKNVIERTPQIIAQTRDLLPAGFPAEIANPIFNGMAGAARRLTEQKRSL